MRVSTSTRGFLLTLAALAVLTANINCSRRGSSPGGDDTGGFQFSLKLSSLAQIDTVNYRVSGNGIVPITGSIDVSGSNMATAVISGLPAAMSYVVEATAISIDGKTACMGNASVNIVSGQESQANLILQCKGPTAASTGTVRIDGTFDNCPVVTAITATPVPASAPVGGTFTLFGTFSDLDGDPVSFIWQQAPVLGSFGSSTAAMATFKCSSAGLTTLTLSVSDGTCGSQATFSVLCAANGSDGGTDADARPLSEDTAPRDAAMGVGGASGVGGATGAGAGGASTVDAATGAGGASVVDAATGSGGATGVGGATGAGGVSGVGGAGSAPSACDQCTFGVQPGERDICAATVHGCFNCSPTTDGCAELADAADRALCQNLYACLVAPSHAGTSVSGSCTTGGDTLSCWCGTNPTTCVSSNTAPTQANGPCLQQVFAAAKSQDAATIFAIYSNPAFPLGRATNLAGCRSNFCSTECNVHE